MRHTRGALLTHHHEKESMMKQALNGKRVAILAAAGFEESELSVPRAALQKEGVEVHVISPDGKAIPMKRIKLLQMPMSLTITHWYCQAACLILMSYALTKKPFAL
jgi:hypothetical protein